MEVARIKFSTNKRPFVMIYHDFIKSDILTWNEKELYIILLMYTDKENKCFPSISTLCKISGKSKNTVIKSLKGLEEKKLLKKEKRVTKNGQTSNLYILYDFDDLLNVKNNRIEKQEQDAITLLKNKGYIVLKEKKLAFTEPTKVAVKTSIKTNIFNQSDNTPDLKVSQGKTILEKYPMNQIQEYFGYDAMKHDFPHLSQDIDAAMEILYDTLNTDKPAIRINGEDKPTLVVTSKLMRLDKGSIIYAIEKYQERTNRIKNPRSYMLAILYNALEQYILDVTNQVQHDMHN